MVRRVAVVTACAGCVILLLLSLEYLVIPNPHTYIWDVILNMGHVPLFGAVALALLGIYLGMGGQGSRPSGAAQASLLPGTIR